MMEGGVAHGTARALGLYTPSQWQRADDLIIMPKNTSIEYTKLAISIVLADSIPISVSIHYDASIKNSEND